MIKRILVSVIVITIILIVGVTRYKEYKILSKDVPISSSERSNTDANIHSGGYAVIKDGWMYYTNIEDNDAVYKKKLDGSYKQKLGNSLNYELNVVGNWIYYIKGFPGYIYKTSLDGKITRKISRKHVSNLIVVGKNIFYKSEEGKDHGLYKMDNIGNNVVKLRSYITEFSISNSMIYFADADDNCSLYKMDFNGKNAKKICNEYASSINVDKDIIYFSNHTDDDKIY